MPDFVPQVAPVNTSLAETLLNAGNQRAAIQARMFGDVGNTIAQIPGQIQGQAAQRQQMALEAAKAQREQTLTDLQKKGYEYAMDQRQRSTQALSEAALKNFDPDIINAAGTKYGLDTESLQSLVKLGGEMRDSALKTFGQQRDHAALMGKGAYALIGTPMEQQGIATLLDSAKKQQDMGLLPPGSVENFTKQWQAAGNDPIAKKAVATSAIFQSPEITKDAQGDIWKQEVIPEGARVSVGGGVGGGMGQVTAPSYKPGSFEATLQADHPGVDISTLPSNVVEPAKARYAANTADPTEQALKGAQLKRLLDEEAGAVGTPKHTAAVMRTNDELTKATTGDKAVSDAVENARALLNSNNRLAVKQVPGAVLAAINTHARYNPGNVGLVTSGETVLTGAEEELRKWSGDPNTPPFTDATMKQLSGLLDTISGPAERRIAATNTARSALATSPVPEHPKILADWNKQISTQSASPAGPPIGTKRGAFTFKGGDPSVESNWVK